MTLDVEAMTALRDMADALRTAESEFENMRRDVKRGGAS
jgi:hypothetical protein